MGPDPAMTKHQGAYWGSTSYQHLKTGWLCLDFANTAEWHASESPLEHLRSYHDLVEWARDKAVLDEPAVGKVQQLARSSPTKAAAAYRKAVELREVIYRLFSAIAAGRQPTAADLNALNRLLIKALPHLRVRTSDQGYYWGWYEEPDLDSVLWSVAWSASRLLTSKLLDRIGECADDRGCGWLFVDMSKNKSRRWCDMKDCGNRNKVQRYYARKRAS